MNPSIYAFIDWKELLMGSENWIFLLETLLRTLVMFVIILISLSILGKRGVKQLSVFELVVIIGLGSAAGDPMFYKDVGLLPAFIVFLIVIGSYMLVTHFVGKNKTFEHFLEGSPVCLIEEGSFAIENFEKETLGQDEFFAELRLKGISQLGQVDRAIIETTGGISVFFYPEAEVKYGLPILPGVFEQKKKEITTKGNYACIFCGYAMALHPAPLHTCPQCKKHEWVNASNAKRVT